MEQIANISINDFEELLVKLLDDDYGIPSDAFLLISQLVKGPVLKDNVIIQKIANSVREQDGRVYLPEDWRR